MDAIPWYEQLVSARFHEFITDHNFNADQIRFLRAVRSVFLQKRRLATADLYSEPLTNFSEDAVDRWLDPKEVMSCWLLSITWQSRKGFHMEKTCNYFVDEAGDPTLFDKKGKALVGSEGCSRFFILGLLKVDDPAALSRDLNTLRKRLLADPYFAGVPSMQPEARKTALAFHAKDDLPEVRKEVFSLLINRPGLRFFAIIRDKTNLLSYVRQKNSVDLAYHYQPNELYDYLVRRLFRDRLHTHDGYRIYFARRGRSDRTQALDQALQAAKIRFAEKFHQSIPVSSVEVIPAYSKEIPALQAVDYFLWSLQRLYERREERYISLLWPSVRLVMDMDDTRFARYGAYYDSKHPLNLAAIENRIKMDSLRK